METIYPEFALYGDTNERAKTDTVFFPISQVCPRGVSLYCDRQVVKIYITYVALSDPGYMKLQQLLGPFLVDWRTTMHENEFLKIFQEC